MLVKIRGKAFQGVQKDPQKWQQRKSSWLLLSLLPSFYPYHSHFPLLPILPSLLSSPLPPPQLFCHHPSSIILLNILYPSDHVSILLYLHITVLFPVICTYPNLSRCPLCLEASFLTARPPAHQMASSQYWYFFQPPLGQKIPKSSWVKRTTEKYRVIFEGVILQWLGSLSVKLDVWRANIRCIEWRGVEAE